MEEATGPNTLTRSQTPQREAIPKNKRLSLQLGHTKDLHCLWNSIALSLWGGRHKELRSHSRHLHYKEPKHTLPRPHSSGTLGHCCNWMGDRQTSHTHTHTHTHTQSSTTAKNPSYCIWPAISVKAEDHKRTIYSLQNSTIANCSSRWLARMVACSQGAHTNRCVASLWLSSVQGKVAIIGVYAE